jgi:hypothetical protein
MAKLPASSADSEHWLEHIRRLIKLGISWFILDFGHVISAEPVPRFAEEVMSPSAISWVGAFRQ